MKNSTVYCLISVCSCFVIILKTYFLVQLYEGVEGGLVWYGRGCFTDVMLHSSENYHQGGSHRAMPCSNLWPCRQTKDVVAARGALVLHFNGVANLH
jgi:hypothetical protein